MQTSPTAASDDSGGLSANSVGFFHVFAQGLIANGPLAATTVALTAAASYALGATPIAYLVGIVVVLLWINTPYQFSTKLASASGVAYFVNKGMGGVWGYLAGLSYVTYYIALIPANALFFGIMVVYLLPTLGVAHPAGWLWAPLAVLLIIPSTVLAYVGIRTSLNYAVVAAVLEVIILVAISLVIILSPKTHNTAAVFNPNLAHNGLGGFAIGLLVAAFGMSGSTATAYLGAEARLPHATVKRALIWVTIVVVCLFALISYAFTVGWGYHNMSSFASGSVPGLVLVTRYLGTGVELVLAIFIINSLISVNLAATIVSSRVIMTFGRAHLLPSALGTTTAKYRTPGPAVLACAGIGAVFGIVAAIVWGPATGFIVLILLATMGEFLGHILGNIALPIYFRRQHLGRWLVHVVLPILSLATIVLGIFYTFFPISSPFIYPAVFSFLVLVAGAIQYGLTIRSRASRDRVQAAFGLTGQEL
ncbi:MAG TPA: APC family permease [Candidatus Saccharimonadales bacterium]|nr:APC family permease [Candidatus Saccharimonadales bacterium]